MPSRSARKGKAGEAELAGLLTEAFGVKFRRTPHSGMLRTHVAESSDENRKQFSGDVMIDVKYAPYFRFSIESKRMKYINYNAIMLGQNKEWYGWFRQAEEEVADTGFVPILATRDNNRPWMGFMPAWTGLEGALAYCKVSKPFWTATLTGGYLGQNIVYAGPFWALAGVMACDFRHRYWETNHAEFKEDPHPARRAAGTAE